MSVRHNQACNLLSAYSFGFELKLVIAFRVHVDIIEFAARVPAEGGL